MRSSCEFNGASVLYKEQNCDAPLNYGDRINLPMYRFCCLLLFVLVLFAVIVSFCFVICIVCCCCLLLKTDQAKS